MELVKRKSPRIPHFDYSSTNYYFVTICTHNKECIFYSSGQVNDWGKIAEQCLMDIPNHFIGLQLDKWVVMPNHIHGIMIIGQDCRHSLSTIVGLYKSSVSKRIRLIQPDIQVWQRSFHDHIIRNQASYEKIWNYIDHNPEKWFEDCFCPLT
ncbi:MAG: hypothetical protein E7459_08070 [Ruminococcaceae bacterium]|nr:hypothetical protein [Oscillospiraceae bacterium]